MTDKITMLFENDEFESWVNDKRVYINMIDRGVILDFSKKDFKSFCKKITWTKDVLGDVQE